MVSARYQAASQIEPQIGHRYAVGGRLIGAAGQGPHPRQQFVQRERLGQIVVGTAVEGTHLLIHAVARG